MADFEAELAELLGHQSVTNTQTAGRGIAARWRLFAEDQDAELGHDADSGDGRPIS